MTMVMGSTDVGGFVTLCDIARSGRDRADGACVVAAIPAFARYFHPSWDRRASMTDEESAPLLDLLDMAASLDDERQRASALLDFLAITSLMLPGNAPVHLNIVTALLALARSVTTESLTDLCEISWCDGTDEVLRYRAEEIAGRADRGADRTRLADFTHTFRVEPTRMLSAWIAPEQKGFAATGTAWDSIRRAARPVIRSLAFR